MPVMTPCIGVCSTGLGDAVCRGCKRFAHEVIHWNRYSTQQQQLVLDRLDGFIEQVVSHRIEIVDAAKLRCEMRYQQIDVNEQHSSSRWVYELLRSGASQIKASEDFGFRLKANARGLSLEALKQQLEKDFYTLSCAHYQRYIVPADLPA